MPIYLENVKNSVFDKKAFQFSWCSAGVQLALIEWPQEICIRFRLSTSQFSLMRCCSPDIRQSFLSLEMSLAYAHDLVLLSHREAQLVVEKCEKFLAARRMGLNPLKCSSLCVKLLPAAKKLYLTEKPTVVIGSIPIPTVTAESTFKYLGHRIGFMGTDPPETSALSNAIGHLQRAPLKPFQKLVLLQDYIIPKFLYSFQNPKITAKILDMTDKSLRRMVKRSLHLPSQTAFYTLREATVDLVSSPFLHGSQTSF